jgi:hypothetical protein
LDRSSFNPLLNKSFTAVAVKARSLERDTIILRHVYE